MNGNHISYHYSFAHRGVCQASTHRDFENIAPFFEKNLILTYIARLIFSAPPPKSAAAIISLIFNIYTGLNLNLHHFNFFQQVLML